MILAMKQQTFPTSTTTTSSTTSSWLPSSASAGKLFVTGATLGPVVDSLHNQCLLKYNMAPITIDLPAASSMISSASSNTHNGLLYYEPHLFASSWTVPPLLGIAYVVLGGILPRIFQKLIDAVSPPPPALHDDDDGSMRESNSSSVTNMATTTTTTTTNQQQLALRAVAAVISTAAIIKLSEYLQIHSLSSGANTGSIGIFENTAAFESATMLEQNLLILITAAVCQWAYLDGTAAALLAASVASIGGPLSELPFVAAGVWEYLPQAADYTPLQNIAATLLPNTNSDGGLLLQSVLGDNYPQLALSSITGPCYFAVTMDAIALGRWFDATNEKEDDSQEDSMVADLSAAQQQQQDPSEANQATLERREPHSARRSTDDSPQLASRTGLLEDDDDENSVSV